MNHPKGEESTSAGERCSNCPQQLCSAAEPSPQELRHCGGGGHLRERNLCGGFCSFFFGRNLRASIVRAGLASPIARRIGSPSATPASPGLASGFGAARRRTGQSEARLLVF